MSGRETDQILVERVQQGDKRALELLVVKYCREITQLISRLIRDPAEVEDVAQDAFIKTYRALPQFRGKSASYTRLYRIAVNTAKDYLATQGRRPESSSSIDTEEAETLADGGLLRDINTSDSMLHTKQMAKTANRATEALPEELCTAITLRKVEGLSYGEIAEAMECLIDTIRPRTFRARKAIAEKLRPPLGIVEGKRWQLVSITSRRPHAATNGETSGSPFSDR